MSRGDGFPHADVDVGFMDDVKVRRLVRLARDPALICACITGYLAVVLASWGHGERVSLEDAAPVWLEGIDDVARVLAQVDLLDADGRIPEHAWESWYGPARDRREQRRESGQEGNRRRWSGNRRAIAERSDGDRDAIGSRSPTRTPTDRPPDAAGPVRPTDRAAERILTPGGSDPPGPMPIAHIDGRYAYAGDEMQDRGMSTDA